MPRYKATIRHHSISRAPEIAIDGTLTQAKRAATARFGDGFNEHEIAIYEEGGAFPVATRRCDDRRWTDRT
jgi:hypothetical protein